MKGTKKLTLQLERQRYAICRLDKDSPIPVWATAKGFYSITRTDDEISIISLESSVPDDIKANRGWCMFKVLGPLDFSLTGILASLALPLARGGISLFAISTYDTDYLMVHSRLIDKAVDILEESFNLLR